MGFRGIDTANQRRHYFESGVGEGLAAAYRAGVVTRADIFVQTKFTYQSGQDHRLPYDPAARLSHAGRPLDGQFARTPRDRLYRQRVARVLTSNFRYFRYFLSSCENFGNMADV